MSIQSVLNVKSHWSDPRIKLGPQATLHYGVSKPKANKHEIEEEVLARGSENVDIKICDGRGKVPELIGQKGLYVKKDTVIFSGTDVVPVTGIYLSPREWDMCGNPLEKYAVSFQDKKMK